MTRRVPAEVFPPGDFIREELEARNWTQSDLAAILKRPLPAVNEIIKGKKAITPDTAKALGDVFQTGPEFWLNLENAYRLALSAPSDQDVARRAAVYTAAPVNEMVKRKWIEWVDDAVTLENAVLTFFDISSIETIVESFQSLGLAARKSSSYDENSPLELAWCRRAVQLAKCVSAKRYNPKTIKEALPELQRLTNSEHEIRHVPKVLADMGIRLVIVEGFPKSKVDGVAFWLDNHSPVIALSLRSERIDGFWFTLCHELAHIVNGDKSPLDTKLVGSDRQPTSEKPEMEQIADRWASEFLVPTNEIDSFILRVRPLYSKVRINQFANRLGIHPGIIVGQLQHRQEIGWHHSREMLVPIRELIAPNAMTDGWGSVPI
ncbi:MAG: ImmA/IrrE family metallo-endopeptidase [Pirellulales bacterium]